ncbi:MAG: hypothetical protein JO107_14795 [Hyphomicrobiales bacterium]|nr:hypothetical protein [Hyphomicrobiales bacterium]MBV8664358.1 hypothetical protein [Hyphomicrobiales bacterium]
MLKRFLALAAALLWLGGADAYAQTYWVTPGGPGVNGAIGMCLNAQGQAIPVGPNCVGATPVGMAGTTGADYSANKPTLPNVSANFGASGVYANYVLIATVPANPSRLSIDVENTSGAQIAIVRDDGTAASGTAPNNASVFALAGGSVPGGGSAVGTQGGSWSSQTFKGRVQVYAPSSSAQVVVMVE